MGAAYNLDMLVEKEWRYLTLDHTYVVYLADFIMALRHATLLPSSERIPLCKRDGKNKNKPANMNFQNRSHIYISIIAYQILRL